jgi:solute carrier family 25 (mitochondrial carnitine/acylcarnitine transporter), member 20/29
MSATEDSNPKYKNFFNAGKVIIREEGYRVLFRGMGATALRGIFHITSAFPTNAATFYVVEWVKAILHSNVNSPTS